jgi:cytochrome c oxidase subunit IV
LKWNCLYSDSWTLSKYIGNLLCQWNLRPIISSTSFPLLHYFKLIDFMIWVIFHQFAHQYSEFNFAVFFIFIWSDQAEA